MRAIKQRPKSSYRPAVVLTACSHHLRSAGNVINKPIESTRHTSVHEISYRQIYNLSYTLTNFRALKYPQYYQSKKVHSIVATGPDKVAYFRISLQ